MLLHHWLPSHMIGVLSLLLASSLFYAPQVAADSLTPRIVRGPDPGVCSQCPSISSLTVTSDTETADSINCGYSDSRTRCYYSSSTGAKSSGSSSKCPESCCANNYTFDSSSKRCVQKVTCLGDEYRDDATNKCVACPNSRTCRPGSVGAASCACPAGTSISGSSCKACRAGSYSAAPGSASCDQCPGDTFSSTGSSGCTQCPDGTTSNAGSSTCSPVQCAKGSYIDGHSCSTCLAGTYSGSNSASCSQCPANTFSASGASKCTACPTGHTCAAGSTEAGHCKPPCLAGHYMDNGECSMCPANTFAGPGATSCSMCPDGTTSNPGSSTCSPVRCPPGTSIVGHSCSTCPAGTYSGADAGSCITCPANSFSGSGASSCTSCPSGHTCAPGSISANSCVAPCLAGHYIKNGQCATCPAGTFSSTPNAASCTQCGPNTFSGPGAGSCTACPTGHTCAAGSTDSSQCRPPACPAGNYLHNGQCTACAPGTFSSSPNSATCQECAEDTFSGAGATKCSSCDTGYGCGSRSGPGQCKPKCPAGNYLHSGRCTACTPGTFSSSPNSASCDECPEDTYSGSGATQCKSCDAGYGCDRRSGPGQCKPKGCPAGHFFGADHVCHTCPRNTYGPGGYSLCVACPDGQRAPRGSASCTPGTAPSHRPRAQEILTCPRNHKLCPIAAGLAQTECINVQTNLESCGGCAGIDSEAKDCSAIPGVYTVSCLRGRCRVQKCGPGYKVSKSKETCVPVAVKKPHDSRRLHY